MIRHCVLLRLHPATTAADLASLQQAMSVLAELPMINAFHAGPDAGLAEGNADFAITADFADPADYEAYATDPTHLEILATKIRPLVRERTALQFERDA